MMRLQKYFCAILLLLCLLINGAGADQVADRWLSGNKTNAPIYLLIDIDSGRILAQKNAHQKREPASTTKMLTALLAIESGKLDQSFTISQNPPKVHESSMNLVQGEVFTLRQLVQAALVKSANDACIAIAEAVSGNETAFVQLMNQRAKQLGAKNTHFVNPHGLHHADHYTTAYDLSLIARAALNDAFFNETIKQKKLVLHGNKQIPQRIYYTHNPLLRHWDKCDGVKTGYTRQAGRVLVSTATEIDPTTGYKWRLLSVVMHASNSGSDSINLLQHQGFDKFRPTRMVSAGEALTRVNIERGSEVDAVAKKDIWLPLRPGEKQQLDVKIHALKRTAPILQGDIIAYMAWFEHGNKLAAVPLVAEETVHQAIAYRVMDTMNGSGAFYQSKWVWLGLILLAAFAVYRVNFAKRRKKRRRKKKE